MRKRTIIIRPELRLQIPQVPNFILTHDPNVKISVASLPDDQLEEIAEEWKQNLLKRAAEIRGQKILADDPT